LERIVTFMSFNNWIEPSIEDHADEFERVCEDEGIDTQDLLDAFKNAKSIMLSSSDWARLENTDSWEIESLSDARIKAELYERDIDSIIDGFNAGNEMIMPLILERGDGSLVLVGGNTRLMVAKALNIQPRVLKINVPKAQANVDYRNLTNESKLFKVDLLRKFIRSQLKTLV